VADLDLSSVQRRVITLDPGNTVAEAIGVKEGHVAAVGRHRRCDAPRRPLHAVDRPAGKTVCPGFYDSHAHMDREGLKSPALFARRPAFDQVDPGSRGARVAQTPKGEWIVFMAARDAEAQLHPSARATRRGALPDAARPRHRLAG
jgi:predicted amidohydrolase YtcJ